ncbi:MAG: hypothetical protein ABSB00_03070 [Minisyncoccia bacterium]|jgi:Tfp pilus assembly protein PilN
MRSELTNLLPQERQRALHRDYFMRLGVVAALLVIVLTLIAAGLLLPTYVFLAENASAQQQHLANVESAVTSSDEAAFSAQLAALSDSAATLSALANAPSVGAIMRAVLAIPRPGITLSGFAYSPVANTSKNQNTLAISGIAATRDALRSYQLALQSAPLALSANLPVSVYAQDTNISFTITVTLAP